MEKQDLRHNTCFESNDCAGAGAPRLLKATAWIRVTEEYFLQCHQPAAQGGFRAAATRGQDLRHRRLFRDIVPQQKYRAVLTRRRSRNAVSPFRAGSTTGWVARLSPLWRRGCATRVWRGMWLHGLLTARKSIQSRQYRSQEMVTKIWGMLVALKKGNLAATSEILLECHGPPVLEAVKYMYLTYSTKQATSST